MTQPAVSLIIGRTTHARLQPFVRRFSYRLAMIEIDIDRLEEADAQCSLFRVDRSAAFAFRRTDHGERKSGSSLRAWAEQQFGHAGVDAADAEIRLAAFPRVLGLGFSPISLWMARDRAGALIGVIYEVHNTFGGSHAYAQPFPALRGKGAAAKEFFVSPFMSVEGEYGFALQTENERLSLSVENRVAGEITHVATLVGRRTPLTNQAIASALLRMPMSGAGVVAAIHWQALLLWLKGAGYRHKTPKRVNSTTVVASAPVEVEAADAQQRRRRA